MSSKLLKLLKWSKTAEEKAEALNKSSLAGTPAFFRAVEKGELSTVLDKLHEGADVHARSQKPGLIGNMIYSIPYATGSTPLHVAALLGHADIVLALLRREADVNARNSDGYTPMDYALQGHSFYNEIAERRLEGNSLSRRFGRSAQVNARSFSNIITTMRHFGGDTALFELPQQFADIKANKSQPPQP